jgi:hypothetical protein
MANSKVMSGPVGAVLILGLGGLLIFGMWRCTTAVLSPADPGADLAQSVGWGATPALAISNLRAAYPTIPAATMVWSPVVHEERVGDYRAVFLDNGEFRAYVDRADRVQALSEQTDNPPDYASAYRRASWFVSATIPKAPQADRDAAAKAIGSLLVDDSKTSSIKMDGVEFKVSTGLLHYSLRAKPA